MYLSSEEFTDRLDTLMVLLILKKKKKKMYLD